MSDYISREAFIADKRKQYCSDCERRKGMKNGKLKFCYEIGAAPCRACGIDDMLSDVEDYPAADVRPVVRGKWEEKRIPDDDIVCGYYIEWHCSCCGVGADNYWKSDYCPNCGASMVNENES